MWFKKAGNEVSIYAVAQQQARAIFDEASLPQLVGELPTTQDVPGAAGSGIDLERALEACRWEFFGLRFGARKAAAHARLRIGTSSRMHHALGQAVLAALFGQDFTPRGLQDPRPPAGRDQTYGELMEGFFAVRAARYARTESALVGADQKRFGEGIAYAFELLLALNLHLLVHTSADGLRPLKLSAEDRATVASCYLDDRAAAAEVFRALPSLIREGQLKLPEVALSDLAPDAEIWYQVHEPGRR